MDMSGKAKPSTEPFLLAMSRLGVTASETMLVGDSIRRDIVPAKALGILTGHAVYGDRNFHENERDGADCVISDIREVIGVMRDGVGENYEGLKKIPSRDGPVNGNKKGPAL